MTERRFAFPRGSIARDDASATSARPDDGADAPPDLRTAIRRATAELHGQLDRAPDQRALLAPGITLERYASIMRKHHRALAVSEAALATLDPARPSGLPAYRPRLPALAADLAMLDVPQRSTARLDADGVAMAAPTPTMDSATDVDTARGRYLGTRYVLEGSTQGAVMIAQRLEQHLPTLGAHAFGFWRVQAEEAPAWKALTGTLAALPARGPLASTAISAARETFGVFLRAFDVEAPEPSRPHEPDAGIGNRP